MNNLTSFELVYVIVKYGMGSKVLQAAKEYGFRGGTVCLGKGTIANPILTFLGLEDSRKEILLFGADLETSEAAMEKLASKFRFDKQGHGIAFATAACRIVGVSCYLGDHIGKDEESMEGSRYQNIITIVNKGKAEEVVEAAEKAGSKGGTIINARGSGIHETTKVFNMEIEPEKEMVMILAKREEADKIIQAISESQKLDQPGNGIIFVQNVERTYGIYE